MSAVPIPDPTIKRERIILEGDVPTPINPPLIIPNPKAIAKLINIATIIPVFVSLKIRINEIVMN